MTALLSDLLRDSAARCPEQTAVQSKAGGVSYAELDRKSDQLASKLVQLGLTKGGRIGLLLHKSAEAYVAIYGILKAGCAYVPLDRMAPTERLAYIVDDCSISTVVTTGEGAKHLDDIIAASRSIRHVLNLDSESPGTPGGLEVLTAGDVFDTEIESLPHVVDTDLAYILYTSGSTGQPKGVMISHAVSMSFVEWAAACADLGSADRISGHAPLHFDLSVFDIFATAKAGATLFPVPDGTSTFPGLLLKWIIDNEISVWYSVPSILSMMAKQKNFASTAFESLRLILFAGEVFPVKYLKMWLDALPETTFMNWFGPTETNVITSYTVSERAADLDAPVPIGLATSNADLRCVNEHGDIVTVAGETGELFARGPCVALGYWGDEEKTRQRFLPNNDQPWLMDRVYRTGDLVCLDNRGNYIYQGRVDHQIKCRGYRIELGEIESALYRIDQVQDAAVVPVPDETIGNRLVAFLVLTGDNPPAAEPILEQAARVLPKYMMPEKVVFDDCLPSTSNGKVDRQNLLQRATAFFAT